MIDSGGDLNYQKAEGSIGGNIISDKGQYQNYVVNTPRSLDLTGNK